MQGLGRRVDGYFAISEAGKLGVGNEELILRFFADNLLEGFFGGEGYLVHSGATFRWQS